MSGKKFTEEIAEKLKSKKQAKEEEKNTEESSETTEENDSMSDDMRLEIIDDGLRKKYLLRLDEMDVVPLADFPEVDTDLADNVRLYHVTEITYQNNDQVIDKLTTVFNTLSACNDSVFIVIDSDGVKADFYIGVRNNDMAADRARFASVLADTLKNTAEANFPGLRMETCGNGKVREISDRVLRAGNVSSVSVKGNFRTKDTCTNFTQGLENLMRAMHGKKYTGIIIAEDVSMDTMESVRKDLQELYSKLSPYRNTHFSENPSAGASEGKSFSEMTTKEKAKTIGNFLVNMAGLAIGIAVVGPMGALVSGQITGQLISLMNTLAPSDKSSSGGSVMLNKDSMYENRMISDLLRIIDDQIKQTDEFEKYGMWDVAGYFVSDEPYSAETAAVNYKALMCGEGPAHELSAINTWNVEDNSDTIDEIRKYISRFVHPRFVYCENEDDDQAEVQNDAENVNQTHAQNEDQNNTQNDTQDKGQDQDDKKYEVYINAASGVSGKELALHIGFPRAATPGLPVSVDTEGTNTSEA